MKTITMYELLGLVKDEPDRSIYIKYFDRVNKKEDIMWACKENIIYKLDQLVIELNDKVEILEEEKKIPEKLKIEQDTPSSNYYIRNENGTKCALTKHSKMIAETLNQIIDYLDYLKSKGE